MAWDAGTLMLGLLWLVLISLQVGPSESFCSGKGLALLWFLILGYSLVDQDGSTFSCNKAWAHAISHCLSLGRLSELPEPMGGIEWALLPSPGSLTASPIMSFA